MDIMLPIVNIEQEEFDKYVDALEKSNIQKMIVAEIRDLLETALSQTEEAKKMGWI